jgi:hypothetical protein
MLSGYWTDGAGCSIETLAELIGDTPKVAFDHYGREWGQHYQEPLWNAIGEGKSAKRGSQTARKNVATAKAKTNAPRKPKKRPVETRPPQTGSKGSASERASRSKQRA